MPRLQLAADDIHRPDHYWWDRLHNEIDIEGVLAAGRLCHRVKRYWEQDAWKEVYPKIQAIRTELWDAIDQYPRCDLLKEYYRQVLYLLRR